MFNKRLLALVSQGRRAIVCCVVFKWLALVAQTVLMFLLGNLMAQVVGKPWVAVSSTSCCIVCAVCIVVWLLFTWAANWFASKAGSAAKTTVSRAIFDKVVALGSSRESVMGSAQITQLMGEGVEMLKPYFSKYVPQFFYAVLAPLTMFIATLFVNVPVAIVLLVCVPLMPASIMILMKKAKSFMGSYWGTYVDLGGSFLDAVQGLMTLKVFESDEEEHKHLDEEAEGFRQVTMRLLKVQLNSVTFMDLFTFGGMALGLTIAIAQVVWGNICVGEGLTLVLVAGNFFLPMRAFGSQFHTGMNANSVIEQLFKLLDAPEGEAGRNRVEPGLLDIVATDVSFSYGTDTKPALDHVSARIFPNSFIGIAGPSGGGKSTFAKLLAGDLSGYTGSITINGNELRDLSPDCARSLVTVVSKQSHVFAGTFRSNLQLAKPEATAPQMWYALRQAKLDDFVLSLGGLDARVDGEGSNLSGGQRQRLCIARALLRDTPVYVFDEATSNVDAENEKLLLEIIQGIALKKTVVMVTHRLKSLEYADDILVLEEGHLVEQGTHAQLRSMRGTYATLWNQTAHLEAFAQQVEEAFPEEEPQVDPLQEALNSMPGMMGNVMQAFVEIMDAEKYSEAPVADLPLGHPSWIPLPNYTPGMSKEQTVDEQEDATEELASDEAIAQSASSFTTATAGSMGGMSMEAVEEALKVVRQSMKARPVGKLALEPEPAASRPALTIVAKLLKLTRSRLFELVAAALLGVFGWVCAIGVVSFTAMGVLAAAGMHTPLGAVASAVLACVCGVLRGPLHYGERLLTHDQTFKTLALIRSKVFGKLRELAPAKLSDRSSGDWLSLLTGDIELLEGFYSRAIAPIASALVVAVVACVLLLVCDARLALLALCVYVVCGILVPALSTKATKERGRELRAYAVTMTDFILDSLKGMSDLLHFGRAAEYADEMSEHMGSLEGGEGSFARLSSALAALPQACAYLGASCFAIAAAVLMGGGALDAVTATVAFVAFVATLEPIVAAAGIGVSFHQTLAAADRVLDVLEEEPAVGEIADGVKVEGFNGMKIEGVSFDFGQEPVLDDISFEVEPESFVGITGKSGVGKSTLLRLMMRFWDPKEGGISLNGAPLSQVSTASLRAMQSYMTQDTYIFNGTLRRNLLVACPRATERQLLEACDKASLNDVMARLDQGFDSQIGGGGFNLSDGERQRVGLARAFLHDASLMLLDEPTSNLDSLNEAAVLKALCQNSQGKTVVIVSHRKAVAAIVDKLLVIEDDIAS